VLMLAAFGWFIWDFMERMKGMQRNWPDGSLWPEALMMGVVAGTLISAVVAAPLTATLRRLLGQRWGPVVGWVLLVWGALDLTARTFACRLGSG
jgi:hypothetical protein